GASQQHRRTLDPRSGESSQGARSKPTPARLRRKACAFSLASKSRSKEFLCRREQPLQPFRHTRSQYRGRALKILELCKTLDVRWLSDTTICDDCRDE